MRINDSREGKGAKMKKLFIMMGLAIASMFSSTESQAAGEYCRQTILHSYNNTLATSSLAQRKIHDVFVSHPSLCMTNATILKMALTESCRATGGALARIQVHYTTSLGSTLLATYQAYCQDLAPDLFPCTKWDKVTNKWVTDPYCNVGGSYGGDGP